MRIETRQGVVVFGVTVTAIALVITHGISWSLLSIAMFWQTFLLHNLIVFCIAPPVALWGGFQIRKGTFAMNRLHYLIDHDHMTQLLSRRAFIQRATEDGQVLLLDIDHFKRINDGFGHLAGDRAIVDVSKLLTAAVGATDLVGRFGGEEFIVFLNGATVDQGAQIAEKLRAAVANARICDGQIGPVTLSIGLTPQLPLQDIETSIRRADDALYAAKGAGRNRVCIHDGQSVAFCGEKGFAIRAVSS